MNIDTDVADAECCVGGGTDAAVAVAVDVDVGVMMMLVMMMTPCVHPCADAEGFTVGTHPSFPETTCLLIKKKGGETVRDHCCRAHGTGMRLSDCHRRHFS